MRIRNFIAVAVLGLTSFAVMAEDVDCTALKNPQARQQCLVHKYDNTPDCAKLANPEAQKQCAEYKVKNSGGSVDCSKLATPEARQQCLKQKAK